MGRWIYPSKRTVCFRPKIGPLDKFDYVYTFILVHLFILWVVSISAEHATPNLTRPLS